MSQKAPQSTLSLSLGSGVGYEQQIVDQLPTLIHAGEICPGAPLPPVTELASHLMVSPATVRRAYERLETEGLIVCRNGETPFVARNAEDLLRQRSLDRSRSALTQAIAQIRRLAPAGREELEIEAEHLRRVVEMNQAREMQRSLLPQAPPSISGFDIAVSMETASEVGGDYYDFFDNPNARLRAVIGDATGHGLAAGIMAAMTKACLTAISAESPALMMARANEVLRVVRGRRVMMALGILDIADSHATICSAGMPPSFVVRGQTCEVEEVSLASLPLGSALAESFPCRRIEIDIGDAIIAFSDGLPELRNSLGEALGTQPIRSCLAANATAPAGEIARELNRLAVAWSQDRLTEDDLTILVIKRAAEVPS